MALALLDEVLDHLGERVSREGKANSRGTQTMPCWLRANCSRTRIDAAQLSMSEGAVKVAVHRLQQVLPRLLRSETANTVNSPVSRQELRDLLAALAEG